MITDKKITSIKEILPLLEKISQTGKKDVVIIAEDVSGEALTTLVLNKLRGTFNVLAIKAPGFGDNKLESLEDIASTIGAEVITESKGMKFDSVDTNVLGSASRIVSKKDKTIIVGSNDFKSTVEDRVKVLETHLKNAKDWGS